MSYVQTVKQRHGRNKKKIKLKVKMTNSEMKHIPDGVNGRLYNTERLVKLTK